MDVSVSILGSSLVLAHQLHHFVEEFQVRQEISQSGFRCLCGESISKDSQ
jgi:hypothetical protein